MRALLLLLLFAGCGSSIISPKGLSTACVRDTDCVAVYFGDACSTCLCPTAAIATSAKAEWDKEVAAASSLCGPRPALACDCASFSVSCVSNACTLRQP